MQSIIQNSLRPLMVFAVVAATLVGYSFMSAQTWTAPTGTAPANNTLTPVNVGATTQAKSGALAATILAATTEVRSDRYCDSLGQNCTAAGSNNNVSPFGGAYIFETGRQGCMSANPVTNDCSCPAGQSPFRLNTDEYRNYGPEHSGGNYLGSTYTYTNICIPN